MAFDVESISNASGQDSDLPKTWIYETADLIGVVDDADYFLPYFRNLSTGDIIQARSDTGGTQVFDRLFVLVSNSTTVTTTLEV